MTFYVNLIYIQETILLVYLITILRKILTCFANGHFLNNLWKDIEDIMDFIIHSSHRIIKYLKYVRPSGSYWGLDAVSLLKELSE